MLASRSSITICLLIIGMGKNGGQIFAFLKDGGERATVDEAK